MTCKGTPTGLSAEFSGEILQTRSEWYNMLKEKKKIQPRLFYPANLSFRIEGAIKFPEKQELKEFTTTNTASQEILKGLP